MNGTIYVQKYDESYLRLECEKYISREIYEFFTFVVPNHKFMKSFKNKAWDGKIHLFNMTHRLIYAGLYKNVLKFAHDRDYEIKILETEYTSPNETYDVELEEIQEFFDGLNVHSKNKKLSSRDYQIEAVQYALKNKRTVLLSPTSSGKSLIIYSIVRYISENIFPDGKGLLIVPSIQLVEQMYNDFKDYSSHCEWDVEKNVHRIYYGKDKTSECGFYISTYQSLYNLDPEYFHQFDYVLTDEVHTAKSDSIIKIVSNCINASYRIGLTGTLDGVQTNMLTIQGLFGPIKRVITTKELMDTKQVSKLNINCVVLNYDNEIRFQNKEFEYKDETKFIGAYEKRNKFIRNLSLDVVNKGNTLILFRNIESHGKLLYNLYKGHDNVYFLHGKVDIEERLKVVELAEKQDNIIILASYGIFSTGVSIKNIHNVIFASPYKSKIKVLQSIGRGLRLNDNKDHCKLFDIIDDFRYKKQSNTIYDHYVERLNYYSKEEFDYKIVEVPI